MIEIERANPDPRIEELYDLARELRDVIRSEIQDARNILVMSSGYENLDTVLGMLGALDPALGSGLAVSNRDTRRRIKLAYASVEAAKANAADGSDAQAACLQLEAALFSVLNMCYEDGKAQEALENAITAARFGLDLAQGLLDAGDDPLEGQWLNPESPKLDAGRLGPVRDALRALVPEPAAAGPGHDPGEEAAGNA